MTFCPIIYSPSETWTNHPLPRIFGIFLLCKAPKLVCVYHSVHSAVVGDAESACRLHNEPILRGTERPCCHLTRTLQQVRILSPTSPPPRAFSIIWNGIECHSSTLSCPVRPPPLTPHFPYLFYTSLSIWLSVFLSVSFLVLVHLTFFLARALLPFS